MVAITRLRFFFSKSRFIKPQNLSFVALLQILGSGADSLTNKVLELHWRFVKARVYKLTWQKFHVLQYPSFHELPVQFQKFIF